MDNLSHTLLGVHLSRLRPFRRLTERQAFWTATFAANVPDVDGLLRFAGNPTWILDHRGPTHSIVGMCLLAPAIALLASALSRGRAPLAPLVGLSFLGVASHLFLDLITSWGTMLLLPFSDARLSLPWVFIADPVVWLILGLPLLRIGWKRWRGPLPVRVVQQTSLAAATVLLLYVGLCGLAHERARRTALAALPEGARPVEVLAFPSPPGPLVWSTLIRTENHRWHRSFVSILGGVVPSGSVPTGLQDPRVQVALETRLGQAWSRFAAAPWLVAATPIAADGSYELTLGDLRFSNPFRERVPFLLWMRIGPDFQVEEADFRTGTLPAELLPDDRAPEEP